MMRISVPEQNRRQPARIRERPRFVSFLCCQVRKAGDDCTGLKEATECTNDDAWNEMAFCLSKQPLSISFAEMRMDTCVVCLSSSVSL